MADAADEERVPSEGAGAEEEPPGDEAEPPADVGEVEAVAATSPASRALRAAERKRRQSRRVRYLAKHREQLEKVAQHCVNRVLYEKPADPYAALLDLLSDHTSSGVCFAELRARPSGADAVRCEVVASVRGARVSVHEALLPKAIIARGLAATGAIADAEAASSSTAAASFAEAHGAVVCDVDVMNFAELDRRLQAAMVEGSTEEARSDAQTLGGAVEEILLDAAGRLGGGSCLEVVRTYLGNRGLACGPPLQCQLDLETWQHALPELFLPARRGTTERRRFFVGVTPWAAALPEVADRCGAATYVDEVAVLYRRAAAEETQQAGAEAAGQDQHDPDEYCPPLNSLELATKLGAQVVEKLGSGGEPLASDEDFAAALKAFRAAVEEIAPAYAASHAPVAEGGSKVCSRSPSIASAADAEGGVSDSAQLSTTLEQQQLAGSVYCAIDFDAGTAYNPDAGGYTFAEGTEARSAEQLAELYLGLCRAEPLLRTLVRPFSAEDPGRAAAVERLREALPVAVVVIDEAEQPGEAAEEVSACMGFPRHVESGVFALVATYEGGARAFQGTHGFYDLALTPGAFDSGDAATTQRPAIASRVSCSLALPEKSRRFTLPTANAEGLEAIVRPFASCLRTLLTSAYAETQPSGGREKSSSLALPRFREGLRRLGYSHVDKFGDLLFKLADFPKSGKISAQQLQALGQIAGPAALSEIDEFRIWLCAKHKAKGKPGENPLSFLAQSVDSAASNRVTFAAFKRGLRRLRHPAAVAEQDSRLRELFMCFDVEQVGFVETPRLNRLALFSARHQLARCARVRDFLEEENGSTKAAFRYMDEERKGSMTFDVWVEKMRASYGFDDLEDLEACARFIDKDGLRVFTREEFEALGDLDEKKFLEELELLRAKLVAAHGTLADAFHAFMAPPPADDVEKEPSVEEDTAGEEAAPPPAEDAAEQEEEQPPEEPQPTDLGAEQFLAGCETLGFEASIDPRILFNFLDAMRTTRLRLEDWMLLDELKALEKLIEESETLHGAIASLKDFATSAERAKEDDDDPEACWGKLHEDLRTVTHGDFF